MADNIELASGSGGAVVRTDDDGVAHWQYVKLAYGADNTQTIVTSTTTNPLPVALSDTDNAVLDSIQTAVELIDNAISGSEIQADVITQPARDRLTDNVGVALQTDALLSDTTALTPKFVAVNATTNGDNTLVAAVAGKKIRVLSYSLVADGAVGAAFEDGAGGTELTGQMAFAANGGISVPFSPVGHFETTANTLLNLELDAAANVRGHLAYVEV